MKYFFSNSMKIQMQFHIKHPPNQSNGYAIAFLSLLSGILFFCLSVSKSVLAVLAKQLCQPNLVPSRHAAIPTKPSGATCGMQRT
jgi:hypothetical protein